MEKLPLTSSPVIDICLAVLRFALLSDALLMTLSSCPMTLQNTTNERNFRGQFVCPQMTLKDDVMSALEKISLSSPASYPYFESITKTFLASAVLHSWKQEDIFSREPIRRLAICLNTNEAFLGNNRLNSFHYRKIRLEQIYIYRNGLPVADSPISTDDDKRLYFNTISDLAYIDNGHGNKLSEYPSHFRMVFWFLTLPACNRLPMILFTRS